MENQSLQRRMKSYEKSFKYLKKGSYFINNMLLGKSVSCFKIPDTSHLSELVADTDLSKWNLGGVFCQYICNSASQTVDDTVIFKGNN